VIGEIEQCKDRRVVELGIDGLLAKCGKLLIEFSHIS